MTGKSAKLPETTLLTGTGTVVAAAAAPTPRILCATGLSPRAKHAVARALAMANDLDAKLTLLQVMDTGQASDATASQQIGLRLKPMRLLASCEPAIRIRAGEFVPAVAVSAVDAGADLVVLDSSPSKVSTSPIAANAAELAAQVGRPVLVVRRSSPSPYESVLIAADQSAAFTQLLRMLSSWRLLEGRPVVILHGLESPYRGPLYTAGFDRRASRRNAEEWERAARRRLQQGLGAGMAAERFRYLFVQARPLREIQREIRRLAPQLLAIATRHHPAVDRVMRASTGNDLLRNIECDVVALPMRTS